MNKVTVLYKHPQDEDAFEKYYKETHLPLAAKIPNLDHAEFTKFIPGPDGGRHLTTVWQSFTLPASDFMIDGLNSADGLAAAKEAYQNLQSGGFAISLWHNLIINIYFFVLTQKSNKKSQGYRKIG